MSKQPYKHEFSETLGVRTGWDWAQGVVTTQSLTSSTNPAAYVRGAYAGFRAALVAAGYEKELDKIDSGYVPHELGGTGPRK